MCPCGMIRVVRGLRPLKNSKKRANVSGEVTTCVWAWSEKYTFSAPPIARSAGPSPHTARVGTPPGGASAVAPSRLT